MNWLKEITVILLAYGLGCFATGYYLVRWRTGQDLRQLGSGATGGRNAGRVLGKWGLIATAIGDVLKGAVAMGLALALGLSAWGVGLTAVAAVAGHNWPIQLGFRGGKGLGTAFGAALVFDARIAFITLGGALVFTLLSRQTTLSFMLAVASAPLVAWLTGHPWPIVIGYGLVAGEIVFAHRTNIAAALTPNPKNL